MTVQPKTPPSLRAALYTRVSSDEQARGYSLDFQQEEILERIQKDGAICDQAHRFVDDGYTGIHGDRPALQAMIQAAQHRAFDALYVWKIDRLFRNTKLVLNLVDDLTAYGVSVKAVLEPFCDSSNPIGRYMFTMLAAGAEMEHANINERTYHGKVRAMREGKWLGGTPPYGYDFDPETSKLVINEEEARWVRTFYEWFVQERLTLFRLKQRINALGIPTKHANLGRTKKVASPTFWKTRTLGRILRNEIYTGVFYYRKYRHLGWVRNETNLRPREEWIRIQQPAIISTELFQQAARQLTYNKEHAARKTRRPYLFAKKLVCGVCGYKLHAGSRASANRRTRWRYYHGRWTTGDMEGRCENCGRYSEARLDRPIWGGLQALLSHPETVFERMHQYYADRQQPDEALDEQTRLVQQEKDLSQQEERLLNAYLEGDLSKELYKAKQEELRRRKDTIQEHQHRIAQALLSRQTHAQQTEAVRVLYTKLKRTLARASYKTRCQIIELFIARIVLTGNRADVTIRIPFQDENQSDEVPLPSPESGERAPDRLQDNPLVVCPAKTFHISLKVELPPPSSWTRRKESASCPRRLQTLHRIQHSQSCECMK